MTVSACTIVARNYLAFARVLGRSYSDHHGGERLSVLILDGPGAPLDPHGEPFEVVLPDALPLAAGEFRKMAAIYDVTELATAVKPFFLQFLLDRGADAAMFLDPDIEVFAPLDELSRLAREHGIVLIPHTLRPVPADGRRPTFAELSVSGVYNLGFIAVGSKQDTFIQWWQSSLRRDCLVAPEQQLFVDQRLIDFLPAYFPPHVLRDPGYDVAYWNLHERRVTWTSGGYTVGDGPLRFFHFSGFNPLRPTVLSKHQGTLPRTVLAEEPDLARLCGEYAEHLLASGYGGCASTPYGYGTTATGLPFDGRMRRVYRAGLLAAEHTAVPPPPDPLDRAQADAFVEWLNQPGEGTALPTRYLGRLYEERSDLRAAFPDLSGPDLARYVEWIRRNGGADPPIPAVFRAALARLEVRSPARGAHVAEPSPTGVNVAGYVRAELGTGEGARLTVAAVKAAGIPYSVIDFGATASRQQHPFTDFGTAMPVYDVNLLQVNADMFPRFAERYGEELLSGRYTVGIWAWEIETFPDAMVAAERFTDEIWAVSTFAAEAIRKKVSKPVFAFPHPVIPPCPPSLTRAELGLPEAFTFLFCFDFFSVVERKNPRGLVEAFSRAFAPGEGPVLVVKSINGDQAKEQLEALRASAAGRPDILVMDGYLTQDRVHGLMNACDTYVSLHRGEGFGLTMGEAMGLGKPVIATGYSGNLDFMSDANSFLVPYRYASIPPGCAPYPVGARWAEPDLDRAARLMRFVYEHPDEARAVGRRARADILRLHGAGARAPFIRSRLAAIREKRALRTGGRTGVAPIPPPAAADTPSRRDRLPEAAALLAASPTLGTRHAPLRLVQRVLLRLLRPLLNHQRAIGTTMVGAVAELEARTEAEMAALSRQITEAVTRARRELAAEVEPLTRGIGHLREITGPQLDDLARRVDQTAEASSRHGDRLGQLLSELHATTHVWDPSLLSGGRDAGGRPTVGYHSSVGGPSPHPYLGFEQIFRGPEADIRDRQRPYVALLRGHAPIVDVGCGRGEMLDLCREAGLTAVGVDADAGMVERCRAKGHRVEHADALDDLAARDEGSIGAIFSAQFIEHLPHDRLIRFLQLSYRALAHDGLFIAETVNPHTIWAFKAFWTDLTHERPIFPETLLALCRLHGFEEASLVFPTGTGDVEADRFSQGDYAIVARRGAGRAGARAE